jgi:tRNA pseudouridine38-40 synthase
MTIQYDGGRYLGWQKLPKSDRTIQGKLEKVIGEMCKGDMKIIGSGRTDAGVHALGQVANFKADLDMSPHEIQEYINHYLPNDIIVADIEQVDDRFHSRYNVKTKDYEYHIYTGEFQSPFYRKYSWHIKESLDMDAIDLAIEILQGTHDFLGFSSVKKSKKSTVRTLHSISYKQEGPLLTFVFTGDGFLHNMVRILMGTLVEVGQHKMSPQDVKNVLGTKVRADAGITCPPHGLFLSAVHY